MCILAALALVACSDDNKEDLATSSVELSTEAIAAPAEGGSFSVTVTSSENWRVSGLCDWATPATYEGKSGDALVINVAPSESKVSQTTTFKVFAGSATKSLVVSSNPAIKAELLSSDEVSIGSDAYKLNVSLDTNDPALKYTTPDYVHFLSQSEAFGKTTMAFSVDKSNVYVERKGVIEIQALSGDPIRVNLTQAQLDTVIFEKDKVVEDLQAKSITLTYRANVETAYSLPSWIKEEEKTTEDTVDAEGLKKTTLKLTLEESVGSRAITIAVKNSANNKQVSFFYIKQQNPNPVYCEIEDALFRSKLESAGWILTEPGSAKAEILGEGMTGTSFSVEGADYDESWTYLEMKVSGLGAFPALTEVVLNTSNFINVDLSDCKNISAVTIKGYRGVRSINCGDNPVTTLDFTKDIKSSYSRYSQDVDDIVLAGKNLSYIDFSSTSSYLSYYETLKTLDVTNCPALTTLKCDRHFSSYWDGEGHTLETVYVTAAQKAAIDAGTLTVDKYAECNIEVR